MEPEIAMTVEDAILAGFGVITEAKVRALPPEKREEVLDFAGFLESQPTRKFPLQSMKGLCSDLGVSLSEEDIAEARREMWKTFPRNEK
jgi:hypothetical protein